MNKFDYDEMYEQDRQHAKYMLRTSREMRVLLYLIFILLVIKITLQTVLWFNGKPAQEAETPTQQSIQELPTLPIAFLVGF
jgi:hypothetical protein